MRFFTAKQHYILAKMQEKLHYFPNRSVLSTIASQKRHSAAEVAQGAGKMVAAENRPFSAE